MTYDGAAYERAADASAVDAGDFGAWLTAFTDTLTERMPADVPCGDCTACCTSSHFVNVGPDEVDARARIPEELLFPAPGLPAGHHLMGYDQHGHCPMLKDGACSIYDDRPIACRTYDCRVFAAAGTEPDGDEKALITLRVRRWRFDHPADDDVERHRAVTAAADFLREYPECFPDRRLPRDADLAAVAVWVHELFMDDDS